MGVNFARFFKKIGLSLERLNALVEVDEAGNIADAAPDDKNRQSSISRQIKELEVFFQIKLKRLNGKTIRLTEAGRELATLTRQYFRSVGEFWDANTGQAGEITIAAGDSLLHWLLLPRIGRIRKALKGTVVSFRDRQNLSICQQLQEHLIDFGLLRSDLAESGSLGRKTIGSFGYSLFIPEKLCPRGTKLSEAQLLRKLPIATQAEGTLFHRRLSEIFASRNWKVDWHLFSESFPQVSQVLASGETAAILPDLAQSALVSDSVWVRPLKSLDAMRRKICLAWHPHHLATHPHLARITDELVKVLQFDFSLPASQPRGCEGRA